MIEYPRSYLTELLLNRRLDLSMLFVDSPPRGINALPTLVEDLYALGLDETVSSGTVTLSDLDRVPLVLPAQTNDLRSTFIDACLTAGLQPNVVAECSHP